MANSNTESVYRASTSPARAGANVLAATATTFNPPTIGIVANATADLTCTLADDGSTVTVSCIDGSFYPLRISSVPVGNALAFTALFGGPTSVT